MNKLTELGKVTKIFVVIKTRICTLSTCVPLVDLMILPVSIPLATYPRFCAPQIALLSYNLRLPILGQEIVIYPNNHTKMLTLMMTGNIIHI